MASMAMQLPGGEWNGTPKNKRDWTIRVRAWEIEQELAAYGRASIRETGDKDPNLVLFQDTAGLCDRRAEHVRELVSEWLDLYAEYHGTGRRTA